MNFSVFIYIVSGRLALVVAPLWWAVYCRLLTLGGKKQDNPSINNLDTASRRPLCVVPTVLVILCISPPPRHGGHTFCTRQFAALIFPHEAVCCSSKMDRSAAARCGRWHSQRTTVVCCVLTDQLWVQEIRPAPLALRCCDAVVRFMGERSAFSVAYDADVQYTQNDDCSLMELDFCLNIQETTYDT